MNWRRRSYESILKSYAYDFAKKQGFIEDNEGLPRDCMQYNFFEMGDMYFNIDDIMYDIDHLIPSGKIIEWYEYNLEMVMDGYKNINYESYLNGFRHVKRSWMKERLYRAKKKLSWLFRKRLSRKEKRMMRQRFDDMFKNMF